MIKEDQVLLRIQRLTVRRLRGWVDRGWVTPVRGEEGNEYDEIDVARIDLIRQLRDDMSVDPEAVPILLSMIDQVYSLRRELRCVMRAIDNQPDAVRSKIVSELKKMRSS